MELSEIAIALAETEARSKSNTHRLDEVEKRQDNLDKLAASVSVLAKEQEHIQGDVKEIKADVKTLAGKPAKLWDSLVEKALLVLAGAFISWLLSGGPGV